ncbi:FAD-binding protein [Spirosoma endbachense]|uniref:FAD-binding protein n=1 Tax=Spirosoma endbachense TaxID=2666025 RepID=A0A6P1W2G9_9BACT|nr:FAD-binding protein [Spirosoma endbachense]QHV99613.1 FAD-binding protein [Spirosoma endbachense]
MSLPNGLQQLVVSELTNRHENFTQPLTPDTSFKLTIPSGLPDSKSEYRQTTANFQWLIKHAIENNIRLRAIGKNWSFAKVGVTNGGMIDTDALMQTFAIRNASVAPAYLTAGKSADNLFFTECGTTIHILEQLLEARNKSIRASGASNGQTVAGATSTGTHGAAFDFGAVHDTIVGLHIVCGPDKHIWLERASYPVAGQPFIDLLDVTEVIRDDDLFNAAVVSFGSFGFIHGIMLEIEALFWLKSYSAKSVPYTSALKKAMTDCDFSGITSVLNLPLPTPDAKPYHFQLIVNPHQFDLTGTDPSRGPFVRVLYKHHTKPAGATPPPLKPGFTYGDDTMGLIQTLLDKLTPRKLVPTLVNTLYPQALEDTDGWIGTMSDFFGNTNIRGKASSAAIGVDAKDSPRVLEEVVALNAESAFPGIMGLRWVKKTPATLGFTRFPITCVLELDGIESELTRQFLERTWNRLDALGIPYTQHWGKVNFNLDGSRIRRQYGDSAVDAWLTARNQLLDSPTRAVFTNDFMEKCGLDQEIVVDEPIA